MASAALEGLYYAYPATLLAYFVISSGVAATLRSYIPTPDHDDLKKPSYQKILIALLGLIIASHLSHLIWLFATTANLGGWPTEDYVVVGRLSAILVFALQLSRLLDLRQPVWYPFCGSWTLGALFEAAIGSFTLHAFGKPNSVGLHAADLLLAFSRFALLVSMLCVVLWQSRTQQDGSDEEQQSLLKAQGRSANGHANGYGAADQPDGSCDASGEDANKKNNTRETRWERRERIAREAMEKRLAAGGNWFQYAKEFKVCSSFKPGVRATIDKHRFSFRTSGQSAFRVSKSRPLPLSDAS